MSASTNGRIFLSYARGDDKDFVKRLHADLAAASFTVWFDRESLMSRGLKFHQEIKDAIRTEVDRVVYIGGPKASLSAYVREEWQFALECDHVVVTPILRLGDYETCVPGELGLLHCEDFRDDALYPGALVKLIAYLRQPNPKLGALFAVPNLPPHFLGRPDLMRRVRDALLVDLQKPQVITSADAKVGMQGMGGIGKSVLAAALVRNREVRQSFPDGIIWISCGLKLTRDDLLARLRDVAKDLGGDTTFESIPQGQGVLRGLLQAKAVLLVLDDVWQSSDAQTFDVIGPRCRMLLTTRDAGILHALHGELVPVSLFTEFEALQLLADALSSELLALPPEALEVVRECGCLPLAVALSGGMTKKRGGDFRNVLKRLRRADLDKIADRASINEQHQNIWRAMQASVEDLSEVNQTRFAELSVFATDRTVPEAVVATLWSHTGHLDELDTEDLLINFTQRSLIRLDEKADSDGKMRRRVSLHDLLHDYAARIAGEPTSLHQSLIDAYRRKCPNGWHSGPNDGYFFENLCRHLIELANWEELIGNADKPGALTDLRFIETKCIAALVHDLVADYNATLGALPEFYEERERLRIRDEVMFAYNRALREYAVVRYDWWQRREQGELLPEPLYLQLPIELKTELETGIAEKHSKRAAYLRHFSNYVNAHLGPLAANPNDTLPLAYNLAENGSVFDAAKKGIDARTEPWLRRFPRPPAPPLRPQCIRTLEGHTECVSGVTVSPDGCSAISVSGDKTLRVWDLETGQCLQILEGHVAGLNCVSVSPNWRSAVTGGGDLFGAKDNSLRVWDLKSGQCLRTLEGHSDSVWSVSVSSNGARAISSSNDKTLRIWDLESGQCLHTLEGHAASVSSVSSSPNGRLAVSGSEDHTLRVWDLQSGQCLKILEGHSESVNCVSLSPDGQRAVSGSHDKTLRIWDLETGKCLHILEGHVDWVFSASVSPDGRRAVSGSFDNTLRLWDLESGKCLQTFEGHRSVVRSVSVSPDGRRVVSGSQDNTLRLWDLDSGQYQRTLERHSKLVLTVSVSPDGSHAVSGSGDKTLRLWDVKTGRCMQTLEGHNSSVFSVSVSPDGCRAVSGSGDETLRVWDLGSGQCLQILEGKASLIMSVTVSPDGRRAISGSLYPTLQVWDLEFGKCLQTLEGHSNGVYSVRVSPDGRRAVSGSYDATLRVWDLESGKCLQILEGHEENVSCVSLSPDGRRAVSGSDDKTLRVWDLESGKCLKVIKGASAAINSVSFSPDGRRAVLGCESSTLQVWDLEFGQCLATYNAAGFVTSAAFSPDGDHIVCGTGDGQMHFLKPINFAPADPPVITAVRLWHFGANVATGHWDGKLTALCPWCGQRFTVAPEMRGQLIACPQCSMALRVNSFFLDNKQ